MASEAEMAAMVKTLSALFSHTVAPDAATRTQAEAGLKQAEAHDGLCQALMRIVMDQNADAGVRKSGDGPFCLVAGMEEAHGAAIFFKNRVLKGWRDAPTADDTVLVGPADRDFVRTHIVNAIIAVQQDLSVFFLSALERVLQRDYKNWPQFLPSVISLLDGKNPPSTIYGGLLAIHALTKSLYHAEDPMPQLNEIVTSCFTGLQGIAVTLLPETSPEAGAMLRMIIKIYLKSISRELSPALQQSASLVPWGTLFVNIIEKDLSFLNEKFPNEEEREKQQWWKVKKWSFRSLHMFLVRYCNRDKDYAEFSAMFIQHFAPGIATAYLTQVNKCVQQGAWVTRHVRQQLSTFLADCVKYKSTWAAIKPHAGALVTAWVYPQLCFSNEDAQLWEEDGVEYVQRKMGDYSYEERVNPVEAAEYLVHSLVSKRFGAVFQEVMAFVIQILQSTVDSGTNEASARRKSGAIRLILGISDQMMDEKKSPVHNQMENFFVQHIFPEFKSRFAFLRAQCFEALLMFDGLSFSEEQQRVIFESVLTGVQDPELPVKVWAAQTISLIIDYKAIFEAIKPYVPNLMQTLLQLTSEIDMDTLTTGMENLASFFPEQLAPFSVQLCTQMRDSFVALVQDINAIGDDDFEKIISPLETATGILKAICSLIQAVENAPIILVELDNLLAPVMVEVLKNDFSDLITECMDVIDTLVSCSKIVSAQDWLVWAELYKAFNRDSIVFVEDIVGSVDNFIRLGKNHILANPQIALEMVEMVKKILSPENQEIEDEDRSYGCMIAESLLLNLRGHMDPFLGQFIALSLIHLKNEGDLQAIFKVHLLEMVINCMYHSPLHTLHLLEQSNATATFFYIWFKELESFSRVHDKKLSILALTAVLSLPAGVIPSLQGHIGTLLHNLMKLFQEYPAALETRQVYLKQMAGDDEEEDEERDEKSQSASEEPKEEDGDASDDDDDYVNFLSAKKSGGYDYDDFVDFGLEEDPYFETPLDTVDPYIEFVRFLKSCPPDHVLLKAVNAEQHSFLQQIVVVAETNERRLIEDAQKQQQQQQEPR
ncbi:armadillo-type protein [Chytriomyces sp. MP71]|nr:armadillo-type protein [Chytriomyces sp. MP71]